jgi:hypothetical protein
VCQGIFILIQALDTLPNPYGLPSLKSMGYSDHVLSRPMIGIARAHDGMHCILPIRDIRAGPGERDRVNNVSILHFLDNTAIIF